MRGEDKIDEVIGDPAIRKLLRAYKDQVIIPFCKEEAGSGSFAAACDFADKALQRVLNRHNSDPTDRLNNACEKKFPQRVEPPVVALLERGADGPVLELAALPYALWKVNRNAKRLKADCNNFRLPEIAADPGNARRFSGTVSRIARELTRTSLQETIQRILRNIPAMGEGE